MSEFQEKYRDRSFDFASKLCHCVDSLPRKDSLQVLKKQVIRSATSVAANFSAATRARSLAEYYAKICIVVEECDETVFWIKFIRKSHKIEGKFPELEKEALELLFVFSSTKKKLKEKLKPQKKGTET